MMCSAQWSRLLLVTLLTLLAAPHMSAAQAPATEQDAPADLLEQFVYYTLTARPDMASAYASQLLDSGLTDAELAVMVDESGIATRRIENAFRRARNIEELESLAAQLEQRFEAGRLDLARDTDRILEAIEMLDSTQRGRLIAERRLQAAGEYAVPHLLREITEGDNDRVRMRSENMLRDIGRVAVTPLCVALNGLGESHQKLVCNILADIGYPHAAPYLLDLSMDDSISEPTREVARRAFRRVGGGGEPLTTQYADLARRYFHSAMSLIAYPGDEHNNVWQWDQFSGLTATPVPTPIYAQVMAMKTSRRALEIEQNNRTALGLYIASNLKRQNSLPDDAQDPVFGDKTHSPSFYATVFGARICQDVLGMAIDMQDTQLVRDAIEALGDIAGESNLIVLSGRRPLVEALRYPDRRVQYDAALTLGRALPEDPYEGDFAVVPTLASAVRAGGQNFALVIAQEAEDREVQGDRLVDLGFELIGRESNVESARLQIDQAIGVDLVVLRQPTAARAQEAANELRLVPRTTTTPILVLTDARDVRALQREYQGAHNVHVVSASVGDDAFNSAVDELMERAVGGRMTEFEGEVYAIESLEALLNIAINRSDVYNIADAETALLEALAVRHGGVRDLVAETLAMIDSERTQRRLFDAAFNAQGDERVQLLKHTTASVKRFGNYGAPRHAQAVVELIEQEAGETAEAAARLHGAMNLPGDSAIRLILED